MAREKFGLQLGVSVRGQREITDLGNRVKGTDRKVKGLATSFAGLRTAVTAVSGLFIGGTIISKIFGTTAQLETQTRSLTVLTGSAEKASKIISELRQFGAQTPFQVSDLVETAKRLNAFGVEADKVVATTKRLADVSGATGAELAGLATAYGQVQAKGRLQGEELLQFQERGVALQKELKEMYNLSGQEFQKALEGARISSEAVEVAIVRLTEKGGKYADGAIAQSDTLNGLFSTLKDNVEVLAQTIGNVLAPVIKEIFKRTIETLKAVNQLLAAGRAGGFQRSLVGIRGSMFAGATSEGVDRAERLLGQITPQRNRAGLESNRATLNELSAVLTRVRPNDPNADRAVRLQGQILQMLARNTAAIQGLPGVAPMSDRVDIPELLQGRTAAGKSSRTKAGRGSDGYGMQLDRLANEQKLLEVAQQKLQNSQALLGIEQESDEIKRLALEFEREREQLYLNHSESMRGIVSEERALIAAQNLSVDLQVLNNREQAKTAELIEKQNEQAQKSRVLYNQIKDTIANGIGNAIQGLIDGTKTLSQSLSGILRQLSSMVLQFGVKSLLGGIFAKGGVFAANGIVPFARGGVVNSPTLFPFANGVGLMGEAGPEAIMPLKRGPGGRLGVESQGGAGNVVVNVDAKGTAAEGDTSRARQLGDALGAAVRAELLKQKRPGGLLS